MMTKIVPKEKKTDYRMSILSVIAISFVILGHVNFPQVDNAALGTFYGWFPYYSFHLPLFLFISGYFFRDLPERGGFLRGFGGFVWKKVKSLIIPYYIISALSLLAGNLLIPQGITFLRPFRLAEWLSFPWTRLYTITFSVPTWYMIALFIAEIYFVILRRILKCFLKKEKVLEITLLALALGMGIAAVFLASSAHPGQTALVYLRSVVMLFFIQVGVIYRKYLEKRDTAPSVPYFLVILLIQFLIILFSGNAALSPGLYGLTGFGFAGYDYFLAGLTGLALWLRISRILAGTARQSKFLIFIGSSTKYIMSFHVFGFFLLNTIFYYLRINQIGMVFLKDFSIQTYGSYLYYVCNTNPRMILLYFAAGMGFSLLAAWIIRLISNKIGVVALRRGSSDLKQW